MDESERDAREVPSNDIGISWIDGEKWTAGGAYPNWFEARVIVLVVQRDDVVLRQDEAGNLDEDAVAAADLGAGDGI
jgi:hypothetical protein